MINTKKDENTVYKVFVLASDGINYISLTSKSGGSVYNTYAGAKSKCRSKTRTYQIVQYKLDCRQAEFILPTNKD